MNEFPAGSWVVMAVFVLAVLATVGGALLAVLTTRLVRSVCGLALCCFGLAMLYYFLHSPFLALMEILIYVGAICITIIFAVMLAEPDEAPERAPPRSAWGWSVGALLLSVGVFWGLVHLGLHHPWVRPDAQVKVGTVKDLGVSLLTTYSLAFEAISLVLLVAVLGALVVARYGRTHP